MVLVAVILSGQAGIARMGRMRRATILRIFMIRAPHDCPMSSGVPIYRRYAISNEADLRDGLAKVAALPHSVAGPPRQPVSVSHT